MGFRLRIRVSITICIEISALASVSRFATIEPVIADMNCLVCVEYLVASVWVSDEGLGFRFRFALEAPR